MEIQLPEVQSYLDDIRNGSIPEIRLPKMETEAGEVLTAFSPAGDDCVIKLKVLSSETVPLEAITAEEAEQEGFAVPDFCASQFLCGDIETRSILRTMRSGMKTALKSPGQRPNGNSCCGESWTALSVLYYPQKQ
jgi:uncharacterized protein YqfB (UPF0267 family)